MSEFLEATDIDDVNEREYVSRNKKDQNIGYREGNFQGRSDALQTAFDASYRVNSLLSLIRTISEMSIMVSDDKQKAYLQNLVIRTNSELSDSAVLQKHQNELAEVASLFIRSLQKISTVESFPEEIQKSCPAFSELLSFLTAEYGS